MTASTPAEIRRAYGAWLIVCVVWSTTFLAIRIGIQTLPPLAMISGGRYVVAGAVLTAIVRLRGVALPGRRSWPSHALLGALMLGVGNGALVWAEQWVASGTAAVMVATMPFWMIGIEALLPSGERIRPLQIAGLLLGFAGLVLLALTDVRPADATEQQFLKGAIAIQASCCGWALGSAYSKRYARHENAIAAAALQMIFGGVMLMVAGALLGEWKAVHPELSGLLAWGYLIVFGAIAGYASYVYALKHLPVSTVSLYAYITPVLAVVLGAVVMREPFTPGMAVAVAIIFAGMLVVRRHAGTSRS